MSRASTRIDASTCGARSVAAAVAICGAALKDERELVAGKRGPIRLSDPGE